MIQLDSNALDCSTKNGQIGDHTGFLAARTRHRNSCVVSVPVYSSARFRIVGSFKGMSRFKIETLRQFEVHLIPKVL